MIVIIDNYDSFTYNLYNYLADKNKVVVFRNDKVSLNYLESLDIKGFIFSPGPGHPSDSGVCLDIVERFHQEVPILGVCLGMQAIAMFFGGDIIYADQLIHGKASPIFHLQKNLYKTMSNPFLGGRYHSLMVNKENLPGQIAIDAVTEGGIIMGIKHKEYPCFGVQFHPESYLTPEGYRFIERFIEECEKYTNRRGDNDSSNT